MLIALLAVNLETSDKVTGPAVTFRHFQMHFWIPLPSKVIDLPWNQPLFLLNCTEVSFLEWPQDGSKDKHLEHTALAKNFVCFLPSDAMTETIFTCPQTTGLNNYWTTLSPFCSTALCHFSRNFTVPSSHNIVLFQTRELFQVSSAVLQGMEISLQ